MRASHSRSRRWHESNRNRSADYAVQIESVGRSLLFRSERMGAVFYLTAGQAVYCREHLTAAGLGSGVAE